MKSPHVWRLCKQLFVYEEGRDKQFEQKECFGIYFTIETIRHDLDGIENSLAVVKEA